MFADMHEFIASLEQTGHQVRVKVNSDSRIVAVFFMHNHGRDELHRFCESVVVDAAYKSNNYRMILLNFVVAGAVASKTRTKQLATVRVGGCWMRNETTEY
ncbi:hypothetical protein A0J61_10206 [Choanephora cucurbitarum]|uniref:ZSWIM1/3 RNaseH-like domain-containing protein n=1 Tax=Choanephora cucurbitarum TaxID=101091 RepID=A0A1C7MY14_9FUNG|nr:hypothetical protein A0J61_10206 [Choanephora cucurbitarum]